MLVRGPREPIAHVDNLVKHGRSKGHGTKQPGWRHKANFVSWVSRNLNEAIPTRLHFKKIDPSVLLHAQLHGLCRIQSDVFLEQRKRIQRVWVESNTQTAQQAEE